MRQKPFVPALVATAAGIIACRYAAPYFPVFACLLALALLWLINLVRKGNRATAGIVAICLSLSILAYWRTQSTHERYQTQASLANSELREAEMLFRIIDLELLPGKRLASGASGCTLQPLEAKFALATVVDIPSHPQYVERMRGARVRLYSPGINTNSPNRKPGSYLHAKVEFFPAKQPAFPGAFSLPSFMEVQNVSAMGKVEEIIKIDSAHLDNDRPTFAISSLRDDAGFALRNLLFSVREPLIANTAGKLNNDTGDFLVALVFGAKEFVSAKTNSDFRRTGTSHIIAVSGLHITLVTGMAWFLASCLRLRRAATAMIAICACLFYLGISGLSPSAVRSGIMAIIYLGGFVLGRKSDLTNSLAAAAVLILFDHPPACEDAGFLLSFIAVLFLSRLGGELNIFRVNELSTGMESPQSIPAWAADCRVRRLLLRIGREAWGLFLLQVTAFFGTVFLAAHYFCIISLSAFLLNLFSIPWLSVALATGFVGLLAPLIPWTGAAWLWAWICSLPTAMLLWITEWTADIDRLYLPVNPPPSWTLYIYYAAFVLFFMRKTINRWLSNLAKQEQAKSATKEPAIETAPSESHPEWKTSQRKGKFAPPEPEYLRIWHFVPLLLISLAIMFNEMREAPPPPNDRITILPASGGGECAVLEAASGEVVVAGRIDRSGQDVVQYLRSQRRGRLDEVLDINKPSAEKLFEDSDGLLYIQEQFDCSHSYLLQARQESPPQIYSGICRDGSSVRTMRFDRPIELAGQCAFSAQWLDKDGKLELASWQIGRGGLCALVSERNQLKNLAAAWEKQTPAPSPDLCLLRLRDRYPPYALTKSTSPEGRKLRQLLSGPAVGIAGDKGKSMPSTTRLAKPFFSIVSGKLEKLPPEMNRLRWGALRISADASGFAEIFGYDGASWIRLDSVRQ